MSVHMNKRRILVGAGGALATAAALTLALQAPGAAAEEPASEKVQAASMTASPSTGLRDGQTISITAAGLQVGTTYTLGECGLVGEVFSCNGADLVTVRPDADGNARANLTVRIKFQGSVGPDGTPGPSVDCTVVECGLGMFNENGDNAGAAISFA
ncbi:hypothetical protein JIG36_31940 [Actinoplanes sp. LDG1-06]|uniref:Macromomycin n=1 Tax=Paractinoplanes ovalisporus TaxID=2810368 RepID=A0ABS2ALP3_9ACTN|nr:enediyne antibiotic chromoprotein [Actinoplanes ovalisporus]MBM2620136.1 hypothetical protein [Actinoplanes ovalisporus]